MNQADVSKLVSQLRIKVNPRLRKFRSPQGPEGRLNKLRKTVTALIKHERLELNYPRADEARMYAERLISDAIRYGDCHRTTMEMADYWILEKEYVHKLFKVLVPRYENYGISYTRLLKAPQPYPGQYKKAILELRGNPYPSLVPDMHSNRNLIHNVLLDEAKKAYREKKYAEIAAKIDEAEQKFGVKQETASVSTDVSGTNVEDKEESAVDRVNKEKVVAEAETKHEIKDNTNEKSSDLEMKPKVETKVESKQEKDSEKEKSKVIEKVDEK